jgi:hypothetical protein
MHLLGLPGYRFTQMATPASYFFQENAMSFVHSFSHLDDHAPVLIIMLFVNGNKYI